jgi:hypothetical protein
MENEAFERFGREMRSFAALIILNIVGAGLAISFGISWIMPNIAPLFSGQPIYLEQLVRAGLAVAGCVVALRWLVSCAETFDGVDDIVDGSWKADMERRGDALTARIVESMAWYRERRGNIWRLKLGCRLTGAFFVVSAALQAYNFVTTFGSATQSMLIMSVVGLVLCLALGAIGVIVPALIDRFIGTWDQRVKASGEAEDKLGKLFEGP